MWHMGVGTWDIRVLISGWFWASSALISGVMDTRPHLLSVITFPVLIPVSNYTAGHSAESNLPTRNHPNDRELHPSLLQVWCQPGLSSRRRGNVLWLILMLMCRGRQCGLLVFGGTCDCRQRRRSWNARQIFTSAYHWWLWKPWRCRLQQGNRQQWNTFGRYTLWWRREDAGKTWLWWFYWYMQ